MQYVSDDSMDRSKDCISKDRGNTGNAIWIIQRLCFIRLQSYLLIFYILHTFEKCLNVFCLWIWYKFMHKNIQIIWPVKSFAKYFQCAQHSFLHILQGNGTKLASSCRLWLNVCLKNRKSPNILFSSTLYNKNILQNINVVLQTK